MPDSNEAIRQQLARLFKDEQRLLSEVQRLEAELNEGRLHGPEREWVENDRAACQLRLDENRERQRGVIAAGQLDAPHHRFPDRELADFRASVRREKLVFIMTKFPEDDHLRAGNKDAIQLAAVLETLKTALRDRGYDARIATKKYRELLWDNVAFHMVGCGAGIAILEDQYVKELNPNVAMEWGYMRGSGREVHFLKEKSFSRLRADFMGRIAEDFDWAAPEDGIRAAVEKWFP